MIGRLRSAGSGLFLSVSVLAGAADGPSNDAPQRTGAVHDTDGGGSILNTPLSSGQGASASAALADMTHIDPAAMKSHCKLQLAVFDFYPGRGGRRSAQRLADTASMKIGYASSPVSACQRSTGPETGSTEKQCGFASSQVCH